MLIKKWNTENNDAYVWLSPYCLNILAWNFRIYAKKSIGMILFAKNGDKINENQKLSLVENWEKLYIARDEYQNAISKIQENLWEILSKETIPLEHRASILHDTTSETLKQTLDSRMPDIKPKTLETLNDLVVNSFNFIKTEEAIKSINSLIKHDNATYMHSLNVFLYTLILFSWIPEDKLPKESKIQYWIWALLHDIGKTLIPAEIINKPWKLTDSEFIIMKQHSILGISMLSGIKVSQEIYNAVLFHHERFNGQGYPSRLNWENIPPIMIWEKIPIWVRAITIADVFEALTAERPYRKAMEQLQAFKIMINEMSWYFDNELLKIFVEKIAGRR